MYAEFMKRQRVKLPWDLCCENKTYKLKRSISNLVPSVFLVSDMADESARKSDD